MPSHSGVQQAPASQTSPSLQTPQEPPQPSSPQVASSQLGEQERISTSSTRITVSKIESPTSVAWNFTVKVSPLTTALSGTMTSTQGVLNTPP
jgi:hypothetical protein